MATRDVSLAVGGLCLMIALIRFVQGIRVLRYQRQLKRIPKFAMGSDDIPVSDKYLFLGKGFIWEQKHTQRIHDLRTSEGKKYTDDSRIMRWLKRKKIEWENKAIRGYFIALITKDFIFNPLKIGFDIGGYPYLHGVGVEDESNVYLLNSNRRQHVIFKGSTGVGKTRTAEVIITQDIKRGNNAVIVIDPKGDADLLLTTYIEAVNAGRKIYVFHLGFPHLSARYNAIGSFSRITEIATRIANNLPNQGDSAAFKEFSWQFVNVVAVALIALSIRPTFKDIRKYIRSIDPLLVDYGKYWLEKNHEGWKKKYSDMQNGLSDKAISGTAQKGRQKDAVAMMRLLEEYEVDDPIVQGLLFAFKFEKTYFDKLTNAVGPFLDKLTTGKIEEIVAPIYGDVNDHRPIIDWEEVIRQEAVVYVGLDALTDPEVASAIGSSMFADLTSNAGRKYKYGSNAGLPPLKGERNPDVIIHGDEFSDLLGPYMKTLLNKSRGAGYMLNLYTQTWHDVEAELGDAAKAGQIAGNINTMVIMRVQDTKTAEMFTDKLYETSVHTLMAVSGVKDKGIVDGKVSFESQNEDRISNERVPLITPADITGLPIGQAFVLMNGAEAWKVRIPEPKKRDLDGVPDFILEMTAEMRKKYKSSENWFDYEDSFDYARMVS